MLKRGLMLCFVIFSLIGLLILTKQVQLPQVFRPKAGVVGVILSLLPSSTDMKPGDKTSFDLNLDPAGDSISAIELSLTYDSTVIDITDITATDLLPQVLGKDLSQPGKAKIILLAGNSNAQVKNGIVAKIYVTAKKNGSSPITLDRDNKVSALGKTGDVLDAVNSAEVNVGGGTADNPSETHPQENNGASDRVQEVINQYLTPNPQTEATKAAKNIIQQYQGIASDYIKEFINSINMNLENRAQKILDKK